MAANTLNSHMDVSQTTTKIDWLSGPLFLAQLQVGQLHRKQSLNELVYVVCALSPHLSTTKTDGKKEATNRRRFCSKGDFASI